MTKFLFAVILAFAFSLPLNKLHKEELVELAEKAETVEYGRWTMELSCNGFDICPWVSVRRRIIPGASTAQFRIQPIPDPTGCLVRHNVPNINQLQISDDGGQTWRFAGGSSLICANIGMTFDGEPVFEETEAPTEAPTEPPTEAPTQPPTEAPTEPPTEAPTQPPTEAPAEEEEGGKEEGDSQCERTDGRCGPLFDGAKCSGLPAYAIYCNADNGWCGNTDAHRNAQLGSEYDLSSCGTDEEEEEPEEEEEEEEGGSQMPRSQDLEPCSPTCTTILIDERSSNGLNYRGWRSGECDEMCNNAACNWDNGNCANGETCEDTPSWSNGDGHDCLAYESTMEWCADGTAIPGKEWALGSDYNYPENNCCACGKGTDN